MHRQQMIKRAAPFRRSALTRFVCLACLSLLISCGGGVYHTVAPGQTLYRISRVYGVDEATLARMNGIRDPGRLRTGTRLYIPGADRVKHVPVVKTAPNKPLKSPPRPVPQPRQKIVVKKVPQPAPAPKVAQKPPQRTSSKATSVNKLHWPVRGKIVRSFTPQAKAGSGKGIEIAVRSGSEVRAAEAGKVIYSGDGVKGYGHLIILQHENDFFTVYGFNSRNLARQGDFVSQGEKIALSGIPPAGGKARLHFEVRKGKQAVDPILYLP